MTALAVDRDNLIREYRRFNFAHMQHHAVVDALVNGQGARAEAIMREHANATCATPKSSAQGRTSA